MTPSSPNTTCAAPGCNNPVIRPLGRPGRPPIYCSRECRPSTSGRSEPITVELDQVDPDDEASRVTRSWVVRLRRGHQTVTVGHDLGRFSATALSGELRRLLYPRTRHEGDAIE
jgi:hypothetical protein